nr:hypothetical protein [Tanacetum cinerariifolium]
MTLTFTDTHNMVAYLSKSVASKGFDQIIDFINESYIAYALTVNPTIYVSCIKQFWRTVAVKSSNDVTRLQALVDKKKVVVTEATIRDAFHLDDVKGVDCLPNEEIFATLARMGYEKPSTKLAFYKAFFSSQWKFLIHAILQSMSAKRTSWNEFSSAMASVVICLATARELENQVNAEEQGAEEEQGNGNNVAEEPVTTIDDVIAQSTQSPTSLTPLPQQPQDIPSTSQESDKDEGAKVVNEEEEIEEVRDNAADAKVEGRQDDIYHINMDHAAKVLSMKEEETEVKEAVEVVTTAKLITEVVAAVSGTISVAAVIPAPVTAATISPAPVKVAVPATRRRRGVIIRDPEEESSTNTTVETKSKDKGKCILVEKPKPMKKKQQVEMDEAFARKLQEEFNQDIDWETAIDHIKQRAKEEPFIQRYQNTAGFTLDFFKGMSYDDIRPIFEAKFNANLEFLLKTKEQIEEEVSREIALINETPAQKAAKRRKLNKEAEDVEELKQHLEIVPDEDDDVFTEATPLARKVPVVDYQIIHVDNKPRYKIIRADDTHQLYRSFITMLKIFDREDLETL